MSYITNIRVARQARQAPRPERREHQIYCPQTGHVIAQRLTVEEAAVLVERSSRYAAAPPVQVGAN